MFKTILLQCDKRSMWFERRCSVQDRKVSSKMIWQPTALSNKLHSIPHMTLALQPVDDSFDYESSNYFSSLMFIGLLPTFLALFFLMIVLLYYLWSERVKPAAAKQTLCTCIDWTWSVAVLACFLIILMILGLICEAVAHINMTNNLRALRKNLVVSPEILDLYDYAEQFKLVDTQLSLDVPFKSSKLGGLEEGWLRKRNMATMREKFAFYADEVIKVFSKLQRPTVEPVYLDSPFHDTLDSKENSRCGLLCLGWILGFVIFFQKPLKSSTVTLICIFWCCAMSFWLMICSVALADLCQHDPSFLIDQNVEENHLKNQIKSAVTNMCHKLQFRAQANKKLIRRIYYEWFLYFFTAEKELKALHTSNDNTTVKRTNEEIFAGVVQQWLAHLIKMWLSSAKLSQFINDLKQLDCDKTKLNFGQMIPGHDFKQLCYQDNVLKWFFRELLCVLILGLIYIIILLVHTTRQKITKPKKPKRKKKKRKKVRGKRRIFRKRSSKSSQQCNRGNKQACQEKNRPRPNICPLKNKCGP